MYNLTTINGIKDILVSRNETLSMAESVTSGHLQAAISLASMATAFYQGGVSAYNLNQKTRLLHIDPVHALSCNCVSGKVAEEMAVNVSKLFQSDWAIAITGYAAPVPDLGIHDLFSFFAVAYKGEIQKVDRVMAKKDDPLNVQVFYTNEVFRLFLAVLTDTKR